MSISVPKVVTGTEGDPTAPWPNLARVWRHIGPPLRPEAQDIAFYTDAIQGWMRVGGTPRVLLLGVTPELYRLPWPAGTDFLAVDHTQAMIDTVWSGPTECVRCAEWVAPGLPAGSRDIALCDGGLQLLPHPWGQQQLACMLRHVLVEGGIFVIRLYLHPARRESPEAVLDDLLAGRIANLNLLKLRLGNALVHHPAEGVELATLWRTLHAAVPDMERLAAQLGWPEGCMQAFHVYRDSPARYCFLTLEDTLDLFCREPGGFALHRKYEPTYELGELCPTLVLRRLSTSGGSQ
ncbi:MAG: class I SAM-dependent methyltransferase [Armatimonadota bacterium]